MSESKHTPGRWLFHKRGQRVYGGSTGEVRIAQIGVNPDWEANARLIAAAPDLLEALRAVELARLSDSREDWQRATDLTDAAIAKAEGRS